MSASVQITLQNNPDELQRLNELVAQFGADNNFTVQEEYAVFLCLEELCTNIINYAWPNGGDHTFDVRLTVDDVAIKLEFQDGGVPFDPTKYQTHDISKPLQDRPVGGLGIHLVRQQSSEMFYERMDEKNVLFVKIKRGQG
ncbi:MAG TPA: ATP-binding protein [Verrucomicrobiae bacterium]